MKSGMYCVFLLLFSCSFGYAQERVPLIRLEALENRLAAGGDTTYVVNFWATWCAPCVAELPYFEQLQKTYHAKPLKVLLVSLDAVKNHAGVVSFAEKHQLSNEVVLLNEKSQQQYIDRVSTEWSGAIPATLFVNTGNNVRLFKEQEFDYEELESCYLGIVESKN